MGMFDYVKCEYPLPGGIPEWAKACIFQTKDTDAQFMETYVITKEGRLIHQSVKYETTPESERPYFGKPEWDKSDFYKSAGMIRSVPTGNVDINYHGDIYLFGCSERIPLEFCELMVRFTNGDVQYIRLVEGRNNANQA